MILRVECFNGDTLFSFAHGRSIKRLGSVFRNSANSLQKCEAEVVPELIDRTLAVRSWPFRSVTTTAFAIDVFRRDHGRYPQDLGELVPRYLRAIPPDPMTGEPLQYSVSDDGAVVDSVGRNLTDDGGRRDTKRNTESDPADDIAVHIGTREP